MSIPALRSLALSLLTATPVIAILPASPLFAADKSTIVEKLDNPESAVIGEDGKLYVTVQGRGNVDGDGSVVVIEDGKPRTIAKGMDDPKGIDKYGKDLYVADRTKVWKIDSTGNAVVYAPTDKFPARPRMLNDLVVGPDGDVFVSDTGGGAVYQIKPNQEIVALINSSTTPAVRGPNGLLPDGKDHLIVLDFMGGRMLRLSLADKKVTEIATGLGQPDGITRDAKGRIYTSDYRGGRILLVGTEPGSKTTVVAEGFSSPADIFFDAAGARIIVPEARSGAISAIALPQD